MKKIVYITFVAEMTLIIVSVLAGIAYLVISYNSGWFVPLGKTYTLAEYSALRNSYEMLKRVCLSNFYGVGFIALFMALINNFITLIIYLREGKKETN